jgi:hypothetical protein
VGNINFFSFIVSPLKKYYILLFYFLLGTSTVAQKKYNLDSLEKVAYTMPQDTNKIKLLGELAWKYRAKNTEKSIQLNTQAIEIAKKLGYTYLIPKLYNQAAVFSELLAKYPESLNYAFQNLKMAKAYQNQREYGYAHNNIANVNFRLADYKQAIEYANKAYKIFASIQDSLGMTYATLQAAESSMMLQDYYKAQAYIKKSIAIRLLLKDSVSISVGYIVLGRIFEKQNKDEEALSYLEKAKQIATRNHSDKSLLVCFNTLAVIYAKRGDLIRAKYCALKAIEFTKKTTVKVHIKDAYKNLSEVYYAQQEYDSALYYQNLFYQYNQEIYNEEKAVLVSSLTYRYENEEELAQMHVLETSAKRNKIIVYGSIAVAIVLLVLLLFVLRNNIISRKQNILLAKQKKDLQEKNQAVSTLIIEIHKKTEQIIASIQYAKKIQDAVFISTENFTQLFPKNFIFFKPKEIVSGDFYWATENTLDNVLHKLVAVGDCTGHSVAGAFMSLISCSLLDQIIYEKNIYSPDLILSELHKELRIILRPEETENNDGLDLSICYFDTLNQQLLFAGATQSLFYTNHKQELQIIKGDKKTLGGVWQENTQIFTLYRIDLATIHSIYLATDGYIDQFGGESHKRFSSKSFKALLETIQFQEITEQAITLENTLTTWLGKKYKQMDDISIIGIQL